MHTVEIPDRKLRKEIPSEVSEMTTDQFIFFVTLLLDHMAGTLSLEMLKIKLIKRLLDIRVNLRFFLLPKREQQNIHAEVYRLSALCDSFFHSDQRNGEPVRVANMSFVKNLIPVVCGKYYGPMDALEDVSFCEYRMANSCFRSYLKSSDQEDLNRLIAILYRPLKSFLWLRKLFPWYDGTKRIPLTSKSNPVSLQKRIRRIAALPMAIRYGIFLWYSGCEEFLVSGKLEVDGIQIDLSELYKSVGDKSNEENIGLVGVLYTLAESGVFGSIDQTDNQNLYDVMARLYQVVMQNREMEAKIKKQNGTDSSI